MTKSVYGPRRFAPTEEKQLNDPDYLSYFGDQAHGDNPPGTGFLLMTYENLSIVVKKCPSDRGNCTPMLADPLLL